MSSQTTDTSAAKAGAETPSTEQTVKVPAPLTITLPPPQPSSGEEVVSASNERHAEEAHTDSISTRASPSKAKGKKPIRSSSVTTIDINAAASSSGTPPSASPAPSVQLPKTWSNQAKVELETVLSDIRSRQDTITATFTTQLLEVHERLNEVIGIDFDETIKVVESVQSVRSDVQTLRDAHNNTVDHMDEVAHIATATHSEVQAVRQEVQGLREVTQRLSDLVSDLMPAPQTAPTPLSTAQPTTAGSRKRPRIEDADNTEVRTPAPLRAPAPRRQVSNGASAPAPTPAPRSSRNDSPPPASSRNSTLPPPPRGNTAPLPSSSRNTSRSHNSSGYSVRVCPLNLDGYRDPNEAARDVMRNLRGVNRLSLAVRGRRAAGNSLMMTWSSEVEAKDFWRMWHEESPTGFEDVSVSLGF
ncbi:hypothetical protein PQX77_015225 [Marasmius sp. AFHP31]|nr:hypothetical protein PQX77_015225 [Marasmius sp. AFHP31]